MLFETVPNCPNRRRMGERSCWGRDLMVLTCSYPELRAARILSASGEGFRAISGLREAVLID